MSGKNDRNSDNTTARQSTTNPASIKHRLLNLARERHDEFQLVLTRYALERLLYRLGSSRYADQFVVKGALLFSLWEGSPHRATRDLDLLGYGPNDVERLQEIFRDLCRLPIQGDGLLFAADTVHGAPIREDQEYGGIRIQLLAMLGKAQIPLLIHIGFGDAITPAPDEVTFPTLLDLPAPHVRAYPRETVVAEKFEAMVRLGMANSQMKDFYDLWILAKEFVFEGALLSRALAATFARRGTPLPSAVPLPLSPEFYEANAKQAQWQGFLRKGRLEPTPIRINLRRSEE
jgi:hypothetical protein